MEQQDLMTNEFQNHVLRQLESLQEQGQSREKAQSEMRREMAVLSNDVRRLAQLFFDERLLDKLTERVSVVESRELQRDMAIAGVVQEQSDAKKRTIALLSSALLALVTSAFAAIVAFIKKG